jgi:plastocyanin
MAPGEDKARVPGEDESDQSAAANGASGAGRWADWTLNRVLVVAGLVSMVLALGILGSGDPSLVGPSLILLLPGFVSTGLLIWRPRPGFYVLAGLANSLLAIVTIPFGLILALGNPLAGPVYGAVVLAVLSLLLALPAGVLGYLRGQAGRHEPPFAEGIRSLQGLAVVAVVAVCIGAIAAGSLAYQNLNPPPPNAGPVLDIPQTASVSVVASNSRFSPSAFNVTVGRVTKITILNEDDAPHTFTYSNNGTSYSHDLLPSGGVTRFDVLFSSVGDVPFASTVTSDAGMNGTMRIVAP